MEVAQMRIFTSSWFTKLPDTIQKIGISRGTPRGYPAGFRKMKELAPGDYFNSVSPEEYHRRFLAGLKLLNPSQVVAKIDTLSGGRDVALLCYEDPHKADQWCHRAHVSAWLHDELGLEVFEFGMEQCGCAWQHPKFLPQFKRAPATPIEPLDVSPWLGRKSVDRNEQTWEVIGQSSEYPDQADIANATTGEIRSISAAVLQTRFERAGGGSDA